MDSKTLRVVRLFTAGKEPAAPPAQEQVPPVAPAQGTPPPVGQQEAPANETQTEQALTKTFYFYTAPTQDSIDFSNLTKLLETDSLDKDALVKKLQGGSGGSDTYTAAYFSWKKILVASNLKTPQGKDLIVYECPLAADGSKEGRGIAYPKGAPTTAEDMEQEMSLFTKKFNKDMISIDTGNAVFINGEPTPETVKLMQSRSFPVGETFEQFKDIFKRYRIWIESEGRLYLPNHKMPSQEQIKDGVEGGYYPGGKEAYDKMIAPKITEKPEEEPKEPTLEDKMKGREPKKTESPFEPVDQQKPEKATEGRFLDNPSGVKMAAEKGDYASEPYSGGTDVVQRLVRDQHKNMKIRKMARSVMMSYLKEALMGAPMGTPTKVPSALKQKPGTKTELPDDPAAARTQSKALSDYANSLEKAQKEMAKAKVTTGTPGGY